MVSFKTFLPIEYENSNVEEGAPKGPLKNPKEVKGALEGSITMKM